MTRVPMPSHTTLALAVLCSLVAGACSDARTSPLSPTDERASFAKAAQTSVSVNATDPAFGDQGEINKTVTISGAGFKPGARVGWLLNGAADPTITVSSTQVVNSTTIIAVISIGPKSPLDFRDVQVMNSDRTQGIGAAVFEVTQAHIIPGAGPARGVNDNGEVTGSLPNGGGTFYYNIATGVLDTVSTLALAGYAISPLGNAIAGGSRSPYLFTRAGAVGTPWTATPLPVDPKATSATANAMVTDPITAQVTLLGGTETFPSVHGCPVSNAVLWSRQGSTGPWQRILLPKNGACQSEIRARGLSDNGTVVGRVDGVAAVWTPNGSGAYTLTLLDANIANGIDGSASIIVGEKSAHQSAQTYAVYWRWSANGWGQALAFAGGCTASRDIADASGRATLLDCPLSNNLTYVAFIDPPYTTPMKLGGVGGKNNNFVGAISPSGHYMVGNGTTSAGVGVGVYWVP